MAITLERLASEGSLRARARLLLGALFPSPGYMRKWATGRGWPWAGAGPPGRLGLWLAYIWRLIWILGRLPRAVATVRLARRGQGSAAGLQPEGRPTPAIGLRAGSRQQRRRLASHPSKVRSGSESSEPAPLALLAQPGCVQEHCAVLMRVRLQPFPAEHNRIDELAVDAGPAP